jgi:UDP-glucose:(glucosyl)LPS alpha-1,2-glucosyltransferase
MRHSCRGKKSGGDRVTRNGDPQASGPDIAILLPYGEYFSRERSGAVALCVRDSTSGSRLKDRIRIVGRPLEQPFPDFSYQGLEPAWRGLAGRNLGLAEAFLRTLRRRRDVVVEVHNRPRVFAYLAARAPRLPLMLYLHNDPQTMAWARSPRRRARILSRAGAVICVSDYIRRRFAEGLESDHPKLHVVHNAIPRELSSPPRKEKLILFAGRIIEEKGVAELVGALERVLPRHSGWHAEIIGASRFGADWPVSPYEQNIRERCERLAPKVRCLGFLPNDQLLERLARAAIMVVPSIWPDPFPRAAVEGLAYGCAVAAFPRGGLPEVVKRRGLLIEPASEEALAEGLERLVADDGLREELQKRAWDDYPFDVATQAARLDGLRDELLSRGEAPALR